MVVASGGSRHLCQAFMSGGDGSRWWQVVVADGGGGYWWQVVMTVGTIIFVFPIVKNRKLQVTSQC